MISSEKRSIIQVDSSFRSPLACLLQLVAVTQSGKSPLACSSMNSMCACWAYPGQSWQPRSARLVLHQFHLTVFQVGRLPRSCTISSAFHDNMRKYRCYNYFTSLRSSWWTSLRGSAGRTCPSCRTRWSVELIGRPAIRHDPRTHEQWECSYPYLDRGGEVSECRRL